MPDNRPPKLASHGLEAVRQPTVSYDLVWDAVIHATEHAHLVVEALFDAGNPFENPAHIAVGIGLVWTTLAALGAFTASRLEGKDWRAHGSRSRFR